MTTDALPTSILDPLADPMVPPDPRDAFFDTSHLTKDLKKRTVRGGAVTLTAQAIKFVLRLGSTAILARLLTPADFGLIAMVTVVTGFIETFKDGGLSAATIQRRQINHLQVTALFWINLILSAVVMITIIAIAPLIAWSFGVPQLKPITQVIGLTMLFGGIPIQHQAILRRQMRFERLALIDVSSMTLGVTVGILMALLKCNYWSLVGMMAATSVASAAFTLSLTRWVPGPLRLRNTGVMPMLKFGLSLSGSACFSAIAQRADNLLIAAFWGPVPLAIYDRAYQLMMLPIRQLDTALGSSLLPAMCRVASDKEKLRSMVFRSQNVIVLLIIPGLIVGYTYADVFVTIFLGRKWDGVIPVFRVLVCVSLFMCLSKTTSWIFTALGLGKDLFLYDVLGSILAIIAFAGGVHWGPVGVAIALLIENLIWTCVLWVAIRKRIEASLRNVFFANVFPALAAATATAALSISRSQFNFDRYLPSVVSASLSLIVLYVCAWRIGLSSFQSLSQS